MLRAHALRLKNTNRRNFPIPQHGVSIYTGREIPTITHLQLYIEFQLKASRGSQCSRSPSLCEVALCIVQRAHVIRGTLCLAV